MAKTPVIIWTPSFSERNGQAIVTRRVFEFQAVEWLTCIYRTGGSGPALVLYLITIVKLLFFAASRPKAPIYAVVSRSDVGFLRDLPILVMSMFKRRVICHFHGSDVIYLLNESRYSSLARFFYSRCILIVPSEHLIAPIQSILKTTIVLCENPAFFEEKPTQTEELKQGHDPLILIWNSNILATKGFVEVLKSVAQINETEQVLDFWVLGHSISDHEMTAQEIETLLNLYDGKVWLNYIGSVGSDEAVKLTAESDIVALPSRYASECQPLALIQAMCFGKKIVAANTAAIKATLKGYPAFYVEEVTVESVKYAILKAISSIKKNYGQQAQTTSGATRARARFSATRFDQQMSEIFSGSCPSD